MLWGESARWIQVLPMGIADGLGDLPQEMDAGIDIEVGGVLGEPVIETLCAVPMLEDERRAEYVFGIRLGRENPFVLNVAQDLVLASGRTLERRPLVVGGPVGNAVDPDTRLLALDRRVAGCPILVARTFQQQLVELVVAHPTDALATGECRLRAWRG